MMRRHEPHLERQKSSLGNDQYPHNYLKSDTCNVSKHDLNMEDKTTAASLRLLTNAHAISWSSSDDEKACAAKGASLMTPLERSLPRHHGLIRSKIFREGSAYKMLLEASDTCHLLYSVEKKKSLSGASYAIYDGTSGGSLGKLAKISSTSSAVTYSLEIPKDGTGKLVEVTKVIYEVPSALQVLAGGTPPRRACVVVPGRDAVETKEPYEKEGGQRGLDFCGRGREPSCKNMQLQNSDGKVVLQMVKWAKDIFHVDFAHPFDAFHALGFAIAQFDL